MKYLAFISSLLTLFQRYLDWKAGKDLQRDTEAAYAAQILSRQIEALKLARESRDRVHDELRDPDRLRDDDGFRRD